MNKKIVALVFVSLPLFAETPPCDQHTVTVTGTGSVKIAPDRVSFTVGVFTNAPTVSEAFKTNNAKTHSVVDALKKHGVKDAEIQTSNFSIQTAYDVDSMKRTHYGYNVSNNVTVTREDPKSVSELIQAAVDAGANEANGVSFFNSDQNVARDAAIERAVKDARLQAEKIVAAAGGVLGKALAVTTNAVPSVYPFNSVTEMITVTAQAPAIEAGSNTVTYSATITYELK